MAVKLRQVLPLMAQALYSEINPGDVVVSSGYLFKVTGPWTVYNSDNGTGPRDVVWCKSEALPQVYQWNNPMPEGGKIEESSFFKDWTLQQRADLRFTKLTGWMATETTELPQAPLAA